MQYIYMQYIYIYAIYIYMQYIYIYAIYIYIYAIYIYIYSHLSSHFRHIFVRFSPYLFHGSRLLLDLLGQGNHSHQPRGATFRRCLQPLMGKNILTCALYVNLYLSKYIYIYIYNYIHMYTCGLALRIFNFIDYAVRMSLKPYVPGAKTSALRIFHFCTYI